METKYQPARDNVRSLKMSAAFDVFNFFPAKCTSKLAHEALIHATFVEVTPIFLRYFRKISKTLSRFSSDFSA